MTKKRTPGRGLKHLFGKFKRYLSPLLPLEFPVTNTEVGRNDVNRSQQLSLLQAPNSQAGTSSTGRPRVTPPGVQKPKRKEPATNDPLLRQIWLTLIEQYFSERRDLESYVVSWSNRPQKRTLASCNLRARKITVAREMRNTEAAKYVPALLYHELCHAVLGHNVQQKNCRKSWHGPEFKRLERNHPEIEALQSWIKEGGWRRAVRSTRMKDYHERKRKG